MVLVEGEGQDMRSGWIQTSLADLIDIKHGFAFKGAFIREEECDDVLLTPGNFAIGGGFKDDKFKYYYGLIPEEFILSSGDLLVTMTDLSKQADTLGYPAIVPTCSEGCRYLHNQRLGRVLIKDKQSLNARYLYYVMCSAEYRHEVLASATGTTVKHTSPDRIKQFRFLLPPLSKQRAIAHILGTLDDKIELNRRMNETLEEMARALFKSWFVDFDPVRAKMEGRDPGLPKHLADLFPDRLVDSELGPIPEEWEVKALEQFIELNPRESIKKGTMAPYLNMAALPTSGPNPDDTILREYTSGTRFRNGDTLFARITPCLENGKTAFLQALPKDTVSWGSTEFIVMRAIPPVTSVYPYLLARDSAFRAHAIQSMTGTSGRQRARTEAFAPYQVAFPTTEVWTVFALTIEPLFSKIHVNSKESRTLAALRDALLPKLISGNVRVNLQISS